MVEYNWPDRANSSVLGKPYTKLDALAKSTGAAKYAYDINPPKMLLARALGCPHAHCKIKSIDLSAAEKVPGVVHVRMAQGAAPGTVKKVGDEIQYQGDLLAYVVGENEGAIAEGLKAIKIEYDMLDVFVDDTNLEAAEKAQRTVRATGATVKGIPDAPEGGDAKAFQEAEMEKVFKDCAAVVEGRYGVQAITHMCLEPHGATCEWPDGKLLAHISTQNVTGAAQQMARPLNLTADDLTAHCDYIGGGFGSKFSADYWCVAAAQLAKDLGRPVKIMLDRDTELKIAGCRPSGFIDVKIGADKEGLVKVWDSHQWSTGGIGGQPLGADVIPYVLQPGVIRRSATGIRCNTGPTRAWRAPNHPQACALSQTALDDIAAKLGLDSYDVFMKNLANAPKERAPVYAEEMKIGAKLMDWKAKWHPHGKGPASGQVVSGLGMSLHTWQGGGQRCNCLIKIHPDGGVEGIIGTQDLGTGTRTVIAIVIAETFGLPVDAVKVSIGSSKYPPSPASGGSVTVASVSEASRRAGQDALEEICKLAAPKIGVSGPDDLVAKNGRIQSKADPSKGLAWKEACSLLGMNALEVNRAGAPGRGSTLSSSGVAGIQMAEVEVDRATGQVRMKKFVAVQDCGLIVNPKTATSQIYGAMIMGVAAALFEERIMDQKTGAFLNAECADYKLARLGDIGEFVVELYEPDTERSRGVIGLGEPPTVGPMAAISNAVCNALGVRVPVLPMTPKRVLDALKARTA